jgi:hypothetical protein
MELNVLYILACSALSIVYVRKLTSRGGILYFLPRLFDSIFSGPYPENSRVHDLRSGLFDCPVCVSGRVSLFLYLPFCIYEEIDFDPLYNIGVVIFSMFLTYFYITKIE